MPSRKSGEVVVSLLPNKDGKIEISYSSGKVILSKTSYLEFPAYVGKELSCQDIETLKRLEKCDSFRLLAVRLCNENELSLKEIKDKLTTKGATPFDIDFVMDSLLEAGFCDDTKVALDFLIKSHKRGYGSIFIKRALKEKEIPSDIIQSLDYGDELDNAILCIGPLRRQNKGKPEGVVKRKVRDLLTRKGYENEVIEKVLASILYTEEEEGILLDKLKALALQAKIRYGRRFMGYDLRVRLMSYLLSKGYSKEQVVSVLEDIL